MLHNLSLIQWPWVIPAGGRILCRSCPILIVFPSESKRVSVSGISAPGGAPTIGGMDNRGLIQILSRGFGLLSDY